MTFETDTRPILFIYCTPSSSFTPPLGRITFLDVVHVLRSCRTPSTFERPVEFVAVAVGLTALPPDTRKGFPGTHTFLGHLRSFEGSQYQLLGRIHDPSITLPAFWAWPDILGRIKGIYDPSISGTHGNKIKGCPLRQPH